MPAFETMDLVHDAVLWVKNGSDEYNVSTFNAPVAIKCRWVNRRREFQDAKGNPIITEAQVVVATAIEPGSVVWLGKLADIAGTGSDPVPPGGLMQVVDAPTAADIKGRNMRRTLVCSRYTDRLQVTA